MLKNNKFTTTIIALFSIIILGLPSFGLAQQERPDVKELLENRDQDIKASLGPEGTEYTDEKRQKLKDIINNIIDYKAMAQYALQETYDTLSTNQRNNFVDLFSTIVRNHSLNNLDIYRADVKYQNISIANDSALVETLAQLKKVRTPVTYDMVYERDNQQWVVIDMTIDDVSTAESYRKQFQRIIDKKGYDYLLETLRKKVDE